MYAKSQAQLGSRWIEPYIPTKERVDADRHKPNMCIACWLRCYSQFKFESALKHVFSIPARDSSNWTYSKALRDLINVL